MIKNLYVFIQMIVISGLKKNYDGTPYSLNEVERHRDRIGIGEICSFNDVRSVQKYFVEDEFIKYMYVW